ncbi:MAG: hypothetical protein B6I24_04135 [Bacteroidetes bacterium 4572_128]|nr:MAG: hypothetical protein B6I24_04135 [Bacteroidetes bacterium 4572_128]
MKQFDLFENNNEEDIFLQEAEEYLLYMENEIEKLEEKERFYKENHAFNWAENFPQICDENGNFEGFDVVIGNPPYISAVDMSRNAQLKTYFKNNYDIAKGAYDIFILFLKKATQILKKDCFYSWIIPNRFLSAQYAELIKKELIKNGLIHSVDISNIKVFKKANVYPIIIVGKNGNNEENFTEYYIKKEKELNEGNHKKYEILKEYRSFKDLGIKIMSGATGFEAGKIKSVLSERKTKNSIPFIVSGCIDQYSVDFKNLRFMKKKFKKAFISNKLKKIAKTKWSFWNNKKIVIAGMTKKVEAIFAEEALAIGVGTYGIYDFANFEPKFILALLNSKFMSSYITKKFKDKHLAGGYLSINKNTIEQYPIVEIKTSKLEKEIDILVYKLYNLTKEEIKIIENETI